MSAGRALWRDVRDSLRSRPGRTALAFSGVAIGLFSLVLCLSVLRGLRLRSERLAAELGAHSAALVQIPGTSGSTAPEFRLRRNRLEALRASIPEGEWSGAWQQPLRLEGGRHTLYLVRTDDELASVRGWRIQEGRFLDSGDVRDGARHAVATSVAAHRMQWHTGDLIVAGGDVFRLIGVLAESEGSNESIPGISRCGESSLFIPWTAPVRSLGAASRPEIDAIHLRAADEPALRRAVATAMRVLAAPDLMASDTVWITPDTLLRGLRRWRAASPGAPVHWPFFA